MTYRLGLQTITPSSSSSSPSSTCTHPTIVNTLEEIANLPTSDDKYDNDLKAIIEQKQNILKTFIKSIHGKSKENDGEKGRGDTTLVVPLSTISNASAILKHFEQCYSSSGNRSGTDGNEKIINSLKEQLEQNLKRNTKLSFHSSSSSSSSVAATMTRQTVEEKEAYAKRIELLKLNMEERKYIKLTSNLDKTPQDDATLSSMLYASSVGMNMIVAPISFGVLMYFFAGKLFLWLLSSNDNGEGGDDSTSEFIRTSNQYNKNYNDGRLNIHGVIVGVISGVIMLFIEMILFVIRNHEMDKHLTDKKKKVKKNPFGYDKKSAMRTFHG